MTGKNQCGHGQLSRSCNICELETERDGLLAKVIDKNDRLIHANERIATLIEMCEKLGLVYQTLLETNYHQAVELGQKRSIICCLQEYGAGMEKNCAKWADALSKVNGENKELKKRLKGKRA